METQQIPTVGIASNLTFSSSHEAAPGAQREDDTLEALEKFRGSPVPPTSIRSLPMEIFPIIFEAGVESPSSEPQPVEDKGPLPTCMAIASVNRLWRQLCLSKSFLWTSVSISGVSKVTNFTHKRKFLELMIERSKQLDLMIRCTIIPDNDLDAVDDEERALLQLLAEQAPRWFTASFSLSRALFSILFPLPSLPKLRGVYFNMVGRGVIPQISLDCPNFTSLVLGPHNGLGKDTIPWEQITILDVKGPHAPSLTMLRRMTKLHTYKIPPTSGSGIGVETPFPGDQVLLPSLKVLQIEGGWEIYNSEFTTCLSGIITPALVELWVPHSFSTYDYRQALSGSPNLERLIVTLDANNPSPVVQLESPATSVKDLRLQLRFPRFRNWDLFRVDHALQEVITTSLPHIFPSIETLKITLGTVREDGTLFGAPTRELDIARVTYVLAAFCKAVEENKLLFPALTAVHLGVLGCTAKTEEFLNAPGTQRLHPLLHVSSRRKPLL
ncbi:hypothetical protein DL96DRAFT_1231502 [Flagelloscypha sp. PMI_526]|nr:hypothetical protein DL96DRAFT_1231502 [Flagelloscypha sp. PMI_526]